MTSQRILLTGGSGLLGWHLRALLEEQGYYVYCLVRTKHDLAPHERYWQPDAGVLNPADLEGFDAIIHLGGESVMSKRWSPKQKAYLLDNRRRCSQLLAETLSQVKQPPKTVIIASGVSYYGVGHAQECGEQHPAGSGMAAQIAAATESGAEKLQKLGCRVVIPRFGVVLTPKGGALEQMLTPFKMGVAGPLGTGRQWMSWVGLHDTMRALQFILEYENISGPVNVCAPHPVTNAEFTQTLGQLLHRPTVLPVPGWWLRILFGEMAEEFLIKGTKALPNKLHESGFEFRTPQLMQALKFEMENA